MVPSLEERKRYMARVKANISKRRRSARLRKRDELGSVRVTSDEMRVDGVHDGDVVDKEMVDVESPVFPLMNLPRELRDRVYDFHLQNTCQTSRLRNFCGTWPDASGYSHPRSLEAEKTFDLIHRPSRPGFEGYFYEPVWVKRQENPNSWISENYEAREHPVPELTLTGNNPVANEAWEYYANRMLVDVDALNRFQTWCQETLDHVRLRSLSRLYIMCIANYWPPPGALPRVTTTDERHPVFLIQLSEDRKCITVSSRFELHPDSLAILQSNLDVLLQPILHRKARLDGEDLIESMFAFHNMVARSSRSELVIGPLKKGRVNWLFNVDQEALDRVSPAGKSGSQTLAEAVHRVKTFRYELYRGEIEQNA